jgi:hypothetical protein
MSTTFAPAQLPIAPRPLQSELFSSWMLRVASANCISLLELLEAFELNYPEIPGLQSLDLCLPPSFLQSIARFCRVPVGRLQALDLQRRVPHLQTALLLQFPSDPRCPRRRHQRVGYAFCPMCIANQSVIHVHWEWCFACVVRCCIHRIPLQDACPDCGESDPLSFESLDLKPNHSCRACGGSLTDPPISCPSVRRYEPAIQAVEEAYRAALLGVSPHPSLVGKATDRAFRRFVDDMLQLLISFPQPTYLPQTKRDKKTTLPPRQSPFATIAELIANAAPSSDKRVQDFRYRQSIKTWTYLFSQISDSEEDTLDHASRHWPMALQRRFASALLRRTRRRWPYDRIRWMTACPGFKRSEAIVVRDLTFGLGT